MDTTDARVLLEKTQLEAMTGVSVADRLETLERYLKTTKDRDDLFIEYLTLLNVTGRHHEVLQEIEGRIFHPWEGGEGKVSMQYTYALTELGRQLIDTDPKKAEKTLKATFNYPHNLGEGKLPSNHDNVANLYEMLGHATAGIGLNLIYGFWATYMLVFYTDVFGITAAAASIIMVISRIWDGINDPMMGQSLIEQELAGDAIVSTSSLCQLSC